MVVVAAAAAAAVYGSFVPVPWKSTNMNKTKMRKKSNMQMCGGVGQYFPSGDGSSLPLYGTQKQ